MVLIKYDYKSGDEPPEIAIVIKFDPATLTAKTVTISTTKRVAKEWNAEHGR